MSSDFKYDLSISLIVKNEIDNLEKCLKSILPIKEYLNCEIIITDTGSTDGTIEIAKKYADKFLYFEWCNDFSKARNVGVEASEGRWFIFIDADEVADNSIVNLAKFIKSENSNKYRYASISIVEYLELDKTIGNPLECVKLSNYSKGKIKFVNSIHEQFDMNNEEFYKIDFTLHHYGYLNEKIESKKARNLELLRIEYEKYPNNLRTIYYLGGSTNNENEKIELFYKGIQLAKDTNQMNNSFIDGMYSSLCSALSNIGDYENSLKMANEFLELEKRCVPPRLEMLYIIFLTYRFMEDVENQYNAFLDYKVLFKYLDKNRKSISYFKGISKYFSSCVYLESCINLAETLLNNGNIDKAENILYDNNIFDYRNGCEQISFVPEYLKVATLLEKDSLTKEIRNLFNREKGESEKAELMKEIKRAVYLLGEFGDKLINILNSEELAVSIDNMKLGDYIKRDIKNSDKEFKKLSAKIKQAVRICIKKKQKLRAFEALEEYKKVNPLDPEIDILFAQIELL